MKKLISMTDFVFKITETILDESITEIEKLYKLKNFANFIIQKLEISMFVPCKLVDGVWVVLEDTYSKKPDRNDYFNDQEGNLELYQHNINLWKEYQEAKESVLFEGFEVKKFKTGTCYLDFADGNLLVTNQFVKYDFKNFKTVEDLVKHNLELTASAKKQLGI